MGYLTRRETPRNVISARKSSSVARAAKIPVEGKHFPFLLEIAYRRHWTRIPTGVSSLVSFILASEEPLSRRFENVEISVWEKIRWKVSIARNENSPPPLYRVCREIPRVSSTFVILAIAFQHGIIAHHIASRRKSHNRKIPHR